MFSTVLQSEIQMVPKTPAVANVYLATNGMMLVANYLVNKIIFSTVGNVKSTVRSSTIAMSQHHLLRAIVLLGFIGMTLVL